MAEAAKRARQGSLSRGARPLGACGTAQADRRAAEQRPGRPA